MRITARDLEALRPVRRAGRVAYPTREQAGALGVDLYRVERSVIESLLRRGVTGAALAAAMGAGSCGMGTTANLGGAPWPSELLEAEARVVAQRIFSDAGITLQESYRYTVDSVDFIADGFDPDLGVGYDFQSVYDSTLDEEYCDEDEALVLADEMEGGGDAIKILRGTGLGYNADLEHLESQLEEFITWLRDNGRI
jgi:hypothetical protein